MGHRLYEAGIRIEQICNRSAKTGEVLARELQAGFTNLLDNMETGADVYIIAVSDDVVAPLMDTGCFLQEKLVVHTAGTVNMDIFRGNAGNYGVLYPLQTLTKERPVDFRKVPMLVEANNESSFQQVSELAARISDHVQRINSPERLILHLAGVICSNFSNHLYALSENLLQENALPFELLKPLILETAEKAVNISPLAAQTGPAVRSNKKTIEKHLSLLDNQPQLKEIYRVLTNSIMLLKNKP